MSEAVRESHCLCGAVRFVVPHHAQDMGMCHCGMCRRWAGGAPLAGVLGDNLIMKATASLRWYSSSPWLERGFCDHCGSSLFARPKNSPTNWLVSVAVLPTQDLRLAQHIYIDDKPAFYDLADDVPRLTGKQFTDKIVGQMPTAKKLFVKTFIAIAAIKKRLSPPPPPSPEAKQRGRCVCGAVKFRLPRAPQSVSMCHCGQCRRWSGGAGTITAATDGVEIDSGDTLAWYKTSADERGFCRQCGSSLFWRHADSGDICDVCVGALEDDSDLRLQQHVYIDRKPPYYEMAGAAMRLTGKEYEERNCQ